MNSVAVDPLKSVNGSDGSVIALDRFIQSTRDSGYKTTASAISELVDNSLQADATRVQIRIMECDDLFRVAVIDNGCGMDARTLREALRFGGTSRFNDRRGLGRYGMGLPNASVSQTKRFSVYSWRGGRKPNWTYLDVDEIARGELREVPAPLPRDLPEWFGEAHSASGTVVTWERCDRIDNRRISTTARKLHTMLGQVFRYYLWNGVTIEINGQPVEAIDPLFLNPNSRTTGAVAFEEPSEFEVYVNPDQPKLGTGLVVVTFSELPVAEWQTRSNEEKRQLGIANGAGVSIVRAGREIDFGWFFMGTKRRENYDDWWRCEVKFDPLLDEAFGITHTKQQVRPRAFLAEALEPHVETVARALNARARAAHTQVKAAKSAAPAADVLTAREEKLRALPKKSALLLHRKRLVELRRRNAALRVKSPRKAGQMNYRLVEDAGGDSCFYRPLMDTDELIGVLNPRHGFYRKIYEPLATGRILSSEELSQRVQLVLLAAARAEATFTRQGDQAVLERFRQEWSEVLEVLLSSK